MPKFQEEIWLQMGFLLDCWLLLSMRVLHTASGDPEAVSAVMMTTEETSVSSKDDDVVYQTVYACQDEILKISCLAGYSIKIVRANYGRFSIAICNDQGRSDFSVNCLSPGSLHILQSRCDGNPSCEAFANSTDFPGSRGDPCPATGKYLEAQFFCSRDLERERITTSTLPDFRTASISLSKSSKRIPITPRPRLSSFEDTEAPALKTTVTEMKKEVNKITSKFLSSSIASTNIMDTSDLPVTLVASQVTSTISTTTLSTTTTTSISTSSLVTTEEKQVFVAPSLHLGSNKAYPILPSKEMGGGGGEKSGLKCPPLMKGGLKWNWTLAGDTAVLECGGPQTAGLAYWQCDLEGHWLTSSPDLSQCQSYWLQKLRGQLDKSADKQASIVHLAKDLAHFAASNSLNPGDLLLLIDTIESLSVRMEQDLKTIPTIDQRRVVITQVVQDILKTISLAVNVERNADAWKRLGGDAKQRKCVTLMIDALENAGLLLPEVIQENHEVTVASPNILLSVKGVNFGHMSKLRLPSQAATASENWSNFTNMVEIPSLDLMEHMQQGGDAQILFLSFKSLHQLLPPPRNEPDKPYRVISKIVSVTMGERYSKGLGLHATTEQKLNQPITISFVHEEELHSSGGKPTCAFWNVESHRWDKLGCKLLASNATHSRCGCQRLATFALLATPANHNGHQLFADQASFYNDHNDILVGIMAALVLVLLFLLVTIVACYCRKRKVLVCCPRPCFCCQPFKLMCNGLLRSIKTYFCCHLRNSRIRKQHEFARNHHSFAPSSLFNERIYELHDNSGSVMTTPTFNTSPPILRGSDDIFVSRAHYGVNLGYVQSPLSCQAPDQVWHQHTMDPTSVDPRRTLNSYTSPRRRQTEGVPEFASALSSDYGHIYHEISDQPQQHQQPIHRPLQSHLLQSGSTSCSTSSSGYGSSIRYDNVRGDARGPFVSYPILEDSGGESRPKRPTELPLNNSPFI